MSAALLILITVKATIVLMAAWLVTRAMAHCSAATRHLVWTLGVVAALVLPGVQVIGPRWALPVLPGDVPSAIVAGAAVGSPPIQESTGRPDSRLESGVSPATPETSTARDRPLAPATEISWPAMLVAVWLAGMAFALVRLCAGLLSVRRILRRAADPADPQWTVIRDEISAALGITASVALKMSAETTIPVACGIAHATVFLPPDAAEWPEERRRVVLLHEMAHVVRRDCLVQAIAQLARAVHWFNPLAHLAVARLRAEQERACDDLVLATGAEASAYADHLLEIACAFRAERCPTWPALAMARPSQLEGRVLAILDDHRTRRPPARWVRAAVAAAAGALMLPIGVLQLTAASPVRSPAAPVMSAGERVAASAALGATGVDPAPPAAADVESQNVESQNELVELVSAATQLVDLPSDFDFDFDFDWNFGAWPPVSVFAIPQPDPDPDPIGGQKGMAYPDPNPNAKPRFGLGDSAKAQAQSQSQSQSQSQNQSPDTAVSDETRRRVADALMTALNDENEDVREQALAALAGMRDPRAIPGLIRALRDGNADVRVAALNALGQFSTMEAIDGILTALKDQDAEVREHAVRHVSALIGRRLLNDAKYVEVLTALLRDSSPAVRLQAINALGRMRRQEAVPTLLPLLKDANKDVREQAAAALGFIADPRSIDALTATLKDADPEVREQAARALGQIARGQRRGTRPVVPVPPIPPPSPRVSIDADAIAEAVARAQEAARRQFEDFERHEEQLQRQQEQIQRQVERLR